MRRSTLHPMIVLPVIAGFAIVLQGGLNRVMAGDRGLGFVLAVNAATVLVAGLAVMVWANHASEPPDIFRGGLGWQWWYLVPGVCGFLVTLFIPWSMKRLGAAAVLALIVAAQMIGGLAWDTAIEARPLSPWRVFGAIVTAVGALSLLL